MQIDPGATYQGAFVLALIDALGEQYGDQIAALREQRDTAMNDLAASKAALRHKDREIADLEAAVPASPLPLAAEHPQGPAGEPDAGDDAGVADDQVGD